ncbi:MAG: DNA helicase [Pseudomonadota bacterium]
MRLSAPIYKLKRQAKLLARAEKIPLHTALDRVAASEGFESWSLLASNTSFRSPSDRILAAIQPGEMVLLGARPGQGKTLLGLELVARAQAVGRAGYFFTLDYTSVDVVRHFEDLGFKVSDGRHAMIDTSDAVCSDHIIRRVGPTDGSEIIVVDYLQILDQKRTNPSLQDQVEDLKLYAKAKGAIVVVISQIDRIFDASGKALPGLSDVRLPNPLDLSLFDKSCFLHGGEINLHAVP